MTTMFWYQGVNLLSLQYSFMLSLPGTKFIYGIIFRHKSDPRLASAGAEDEDMDVAAERRRVLRGSGRRDMLRLTGLTKVSRESVIYYRA